MAQDAGYGVDVLPGVSDGGPYGVPKIVEAETGNPRQVEGNNSFSLSRTGIPDARCRGA